MEFQLGDITATPQDLCIGMLVALGLVVIARDLLRFADVLRMAEEHRQDPNKLAAEALEHLGMVDREREEQAKREEPDDGNNDGA